MAALAALAITTLQACSTTYSESTHTTSQTQTETQEAQPDLSDVLGRVVLFADPHSWPGDTGVHSSKHPTEYGRDGLKKTLHEIGAESILVVPAEKRVLTAEDLTDADLLVIYHTTRESSDELRRLLGDWIGSGRPTVVVHCGIGAYSDWPQYREWLGRYWVWWDEKDHPKPHSNHREEVCELHVVPGSGFDPRLDGAKLPSDEIYLRLAEDKPTLDAVTADTPAGKVFIAWQSKETPNLAVWTHGHSRTIWDAPAMSDGLRATVHAAFANRP